MAIQGFTPWLLLYGQVKEISSYPPPRDWAGRRSRFPAVPPGSLICQERQHYLVEAGRVFEKGHMVEAGHQ
jgi:hypothetical protein